MSERLDGELKTREYTIIHHSKEFIKVFNNLDHSIHVEFSNDGVDTLVNIRPSTPLPNLGDTEA